MSNKTQNYAEELNRDDDIHSEIFELDLPPLPTRVSEVIEVIPDGAIVPAGHGWIYRQFELTPVGVQIAEGTSEDEWLDLGGALFKLGSAIQWLLGDWLAFGEREYNKTYQQFAEWTGYEVKTLYQYGWVANSVDFSVRTEKLSFTHHQLVASLRLEDDTIDVERQLYWLKKAEVGKWTISQLRKEMRDDPPALPPTAHKKLVDYLYKSNSDAIELMDKAMESAVDRRARQEVLNLLRDQQAFLKSREERWLELWNKEG